MQVLDLVIIGLAIALEPVPLTAFILVLASKRGVIKGAAFVFGWLASLAAVIAITVLATGNSPPQPSTAPSIAALVVKIVIGVGLLLVAERQRRRMGRPKPPKKPPKWQTGIDNMSPLFAIGLAFLVQPWGLIAAGAATVVEAKLSSVADYLTLVLFGLLATSSYLTLEIYAGLRPQRSDALLSGVKKWIDTHTDQVIIGVSVVAGLWLISKSAYLLVT